MAGQSKVSGDATIIGRETFLEGGRLWVSHDLRIDGDLAVDVESTARVVISPTGRVRGTISAETLEIAGQVDGDVVVSELLVIRAGALVNGAVRAGRLRIEEGAHGSAKFLVAAADGQGDPESWRREAETAMERAMASVDEARRLANVTPSHRQPAQDGETVAAKLDNGRPQDAGEVPGRGGPIALFRTEESGRTPPTGMHSTEDLMRRKEIRRLAEAPTSVSLPRRGNPHEGRRDGSDRFW